MDLDIAAHFLCCSYPPHTTTTTTGRPFSHHRSTFLSSSSSTRQSHLFSFSKPLKQLMSHDLALTPTTNAKQEVVYDDSSYAPPLFDYHGIDQQLLDKIAYDALVWSSLHGLLMGHKSVQVITPPPSNSFLYLIIYYCFVYMKIFIYTLLLLK